MNNNIRIFKHKNHNLFELGYKRFVFNGGEVSIKLNQDKGWMENPFQTIVVARIQNSEDLIALAHIKDALICQGVENIHLALFYVPYARQDRVCAAGESFALKVFTNFLNSLNFQKVFILDPHSDVTPALINNVKVITQLNVIQFEPITKYFLEQENLIFISPDAGANKKTSEIAKYFEHSRFLRADKLRDLQTGKIIETKVLADDLTGLTVAICDDILDGGATFCALAIELKKKNAKKVILFVTHGIFASGIDKLLESGIDEIVTTDSFRQDLSGTDKLKIVHADYFAL